MEPQIRYVKTRDGVSIAFWALGTGGVPLILQSPMVFGHLTSEWDWQLLRSWYEHLAERRTLIRYDMRNCGLSQRGVPLGDAGLSGLVSDIEAVADRLELPKFALMTQGGNTPAAVAFAARFPSRVTRMVLCDPLDRTGRFWEEPTMKDLLALSQTNWPLFTEAIAQAIYGWGNRLGHNWAQHIRRSVDQADFQLWAQDELDATALFQTIDAPVLIMNQRRFASALAPDIAASMPNARLYQHDDFVWSEGASAVIDSFLAEGDGAAASPPSGTAIILFADIVDSTALTERMGDAAFRERARALDASLREIITGAGGSVIDAKTLGDGVLATFPAASQAIDAALRCAAAGDEQSLPLHLGLHAGDVIREQNNVFGGAVNIASRISGLSAPGEVLVSDVVRALARTSASVTFEDRGEHALKGVGEPQRVYAVRASRSRDGSAG